MYGEKGNRDLSFLNLCLLERALELQAFRALKGSSTSSEPRMARFLQILPAPSFASTCLPICPKPSFALFLIHPSKPRLDATPVSSWGFQDQTLPWASLLHPPPSLPALPPELTLQAPGSVWICGCGALSGESYCVSGKTENPAPAHPGVLASQHNLLG